jgi:hypothetical protein
MYKTNLGVIAVILTKTARRSMRSFLKAKLYFRGNAEFMDCTDRFDAELPPAIPGVEWIPNATLTSATVHLRIQAVPVRAASNVDSLRFPEASRRR